MRKTEVENILELCNTHELKQPEVVFLTIDWYALKWKFHAGTCHMFLVEHASALHFIRAIYTEKEAGHGFYWQPPGNIPPIPSAGEAYSKK